MIYTQFNYEKAYIKNVMDILRGGSKFYLTLLQLSKRKIDYNNLGVV